MILTTLVIFERACLPAAPKRSRMPQWPRTMCSSHEVQP